MSNSNIKKVLSIVLMLSLIISAFMLSACSKESAVSKAFESYKSSWQKKDYAAMYSMLSSKTKSAITEKQFVDRYTAIYSGIEAENIAIKLDSNEKLKEGKEESINIPFSITMDTVAGKIEVPGYSITLTKEKVDNKTQWTVAWNEKLIFPKMEPGDKVRVESSAAKRGEIYDVNGKPLAINAPIVSLGVQPSKFTKNKDANVAELAKILDIKPSLIEDKLKANSNPDFFVPIVNIASTEKDKIAEAMKIEGVIHNKPVSRVYPGGEAFGSLIGNIGPITSEELEKNKGQGYSSTSFIGKRGLEQVFEAKLKGENGGLIYISKQKDGKEVEQINIAKKEPKDGESIKLSIDSELQKKIYESMNREKGAAAAVNPKTGQVLALVSSPSFDSNLLTTYVTESQKAAWEKSGNAEFENRFKNAYAPGSTFKLITAAIGLDKGSIKPQEALSIQGKAWQKDSSWGSYKVTRVSDPGKDINLTDAFIYSDNIYFAKAALNIGKDDFIKGSSKFGLGEALPIDYPIAKSQLSSDGKLSSDILLADSGYGQGQVLMSPLHVALAYSAVVNNGNIMTPSLLQSSEAPKVWKENVISSSNIKTLLDGLTAVIESPSGTGHEAKLNNIPLAGKTGTAELKQSLEDQNGKENGWFVCMNTNNPKLVISMMVEDVQGRGGSHYVVPMVKKAMNYYFTEGAGK